MFFSTQVLRILPSMQLLQFFSKWQPLESFSPGSPSESYPNCNCYILLNIAGPPNPSQYCRPSESFPTWQPLGPFSSPAFPNSSQHGRPTDLLQHSSPSGSLPMRQPTDPSQQCSPLESSSIPHPLRIFLHMAAPQNSSPKSSNISRSQLKLDITSTGHGQAGHLCTHLPTERFRLTNFYFFEG